MKKRKVVQVLPFLNVGGAEILVKEYILAADPELCDVELLVIGKRVGSVIEAELDSHGKKVTYLSELYTVSKKWPKPIRHIICALKWRHVLRRYMKSIAPDVVHCHLSVANVLVSVKSFLKDKAVFYTVHNDPDKYWMDGKGAKEKNAVESLIGYSNVNFIALHQSAVPKIKTYFGEKCPIYVLNNAVAFEKYRNPSVPKEQKKAELNLPPDAFVVGHIGRFSEAKNHAFIIEIFEQILGKNSKARLLLIGDGSMRSDIERLVAEKNLSDSVLFLGNRGDVNELLPVFDRLLLPSIWEGFPITLIEAQVAGVRCIVSDNVSSTVRLTNLLDFMSLEDGAGAWADFTLLPFEKKYEDYGLENFNIKNVMQNLIGLYNEAIESYSSAD